VFEKILLALDGSEESLRAAKQAGDLARVMRSRILRIVVAFDPIPPYLGEPNLQTAISARTMYTKEVLNKAQNAIGKIPGEIHIELIEGAPAEAIIIVAKTRESSMIIMGSRGVSNIAGLLLGSTCQNVISHASSRTGHSYPQKNPHPRHLASHRVALRSYRNESKQDP
jgi:nucleotide-binding universal stress UspA family protein